MKNTKEKLLENATTMFAEHGFDGVSTRSLVTVSMVNLCTINYYFGSKQKLYDAVIDNIINNVQENLIKKTDEYIKCNIPAGEKIVFIIGEFFDYLFSNNVSNSMALILFRELLNTTPGGDRIYSEIMEPLKKQFVNLIIQETGATKQSAYINAHCLVSQTVSFRLLQNRKHYSREFLKSAKQQIIENCKKILEH
ncbi:MAG: CerR family C-terminal domain-containing protein [Alphaproteobacteria bacterium]|nr:CerR family C-terminal domain-containing protein [Alphaproteobacteria bacterium]